MRQFWLLLIIYICTGISGLLSASSIDSLQNKLDVATNDSLRLIVLEELTFKTSGTNPNLSIDYAHQTLQLADKLNNRKLKRQALHALGLNHYRLGNYDKTLDYFRQVLRMFEEDDDTRGIARLHNNIGILYDELNQYEKALAYYHKSLEIKRQLPDSSDISNTLSNMGFAYQKLNLPGKAFHYLMQALRIDIKTGNKEGLVYTYENLGRLYAGLKKADSALYFYHQSLSILQKTGGQYETASVLNSIGDIHLTQLKPKQARNAFEQAIKFANEVKAKKIVKDSYKGIAETYKLEQNWQQAFHYFQQYEVIKDSIFNHENLQKINDIESTYQIQRQEKEIELLRKDARIQELNLTRNQMVSSYLYTGLFLLFLMIVFLYQQYKTKNNSNTLLHKHNQEIAARNVEITDSIRYAKTIQEAVLPQEAVLKSVFPESFLYAEARNILNGDFFWIHEQEEFVIWAVVDCTGHGVPGALMTILAHNLLNQIVKNQQQLEPAKILAELHRHLRHSLQKGLQDDHPHGMDLGICLYGRSSGLLHYAGARRPLYLMKDNQLQVFQTPNPSVGNTYLKEAEFHQITLQPQAGSFVYMFTDGITDQFGGPQNKKFLHNRLQELVKQMGAKPLHQQKQLLGEGILAWRKQEEQTDDVLMLAICLPDVLKIS